MSSEQLEFGVEEVLDAGQRLETVPGNPTHLVQRVGIAPRRAGALPLGATGHRQAGPRWWNPSSPTTVPPVPAARRGAVIFSAAGASTATTM